MEHFGITLIKEPGLEVPLASFQVGSRHMNSHRRSSWALFLDNLKVENKFINWDLCLASIILHSTCQESLSEVEQLDEEVFRITLFLPGGEECDPLNQVFDITSEWFQRWITLRFPLLRHSANEQRFESVFQLG